MIYKLSYVNALGGRIEFSWESGIIVSEKAGFTENNIEMSLAQGVNQVGATLQGQSVQPKDIPVTGVIVRNARETRKKMIEVISPRVPAKLIFNEMYYLDVLPRMTPLVGAGRFHADYQFILSAAYPYWQSMTESMHNLAGFVSTFKFSRLEGEQLIPLFNISEPVRFSEVKESLFTDVYNGGTIPIPWTVRFKANAIVDSPSIVKVTTREFVRIKKLMAINEIITVAFTHTGIKITSDRAGVIEDNFNYLDLESTFFLLDPGVTVIRHDAEQYLSNLDVQMYTRDTVAGV